MKRLDPNRPGEELHQGPVQINSVLIRLGLLPFRLIQLQRLIVNGSLKGYDEYAYANNFGYEPPRQALWITHPTHGITFSCAVNVERKKELKKTEWVGWTK